MNPYGSACGPQYCNRALPTGALSDSVNVGACCGCVRGCCGCELWTDCATEAEVLLRAQKTVKEFKLITELVVRGELKLKLKLKLLWLCNPTLRAGAQQY